MTSSSGRRRARLGLVLPLVGILACGGSDASSGADPVSNGGSGSGGGDTKGGGNPPGADAGDLKFVDPNGPAPALAPTLLALTYVGGPGDQFLREVAFAGGRIVARGQGFTLSYAPDGTDGKIEGDPGTNDTGAFDDRPPLPGDPGKAYAGPDGLTFRVGYRQAGKNLQQPIFRALQGEQRVWALWGHAAQDVIDRSLGADTRCYQAWGMPEGRIGVQCWTDGGNSVLAKDPRNLDAPGFDPAWAASSFQKSAGGMSTAYVLVDPKNGGAAVSGTFAASHVGVLTTDAWGRVYVAKVASSRSGGGEPQNPFAQDPSASSGVMVLGPTLRDVVFNARLGGACGSGGKQGFAAVALEGKLLALAGTTCATNLATKNAVQGASGGGQDGFFALVSLW